MSDILQVEWIIIPQTAPQPVLGCSNCRRPQPFRSSGKIRLNANGKVLDCWLIYKCVHCVQSWNRPILRRQKVRNITAETLLALQNNDADLVRSLEFDLIGLYRSTRTVNQFNDIAVRKRLVSMGNRPWSQLRIGIELNAPTSFRLDRLLAGELGISRTQLHALAAAAHLSVQQGSASALQRPVKQGILVSLQLFGIDNADDIARNAMENRLT